MRRGIMSAALLMLLTVSPLVQASDDWGEHCYNMLPFADKLKMRLVRPNPPKWNLEAQAEINGLDVYILPGGGDLHTDLDDSIYTVDLVLYNTSAFFGNHPIVSIRGVIWGPFALEARGKLGVATYQTQGTMIPTACVAEVAQSSMSTHGVLAGDQ